MKKLELCLLDYPANLLELSQGELEPFFDKVLSNDFKHQQPNQALRSYMNKACPEIKRIEAYDMGYIRVHYQDAKITPREIHDYLAQLGIITKPTNSG